MPRASRTDANQSKIVKAVRNLGASVWITSHARTGVDCVWGITCQSGMRVNVMVEIKDGNKPMSAQKLTVAEEKFHDEWKGQICIVRSVEQAVDLVNRIKEK